MIYTKLTVKAINLAYQAHHGQVDKAGMPYVLHPVHLAEQMNDEITCCAALLHDVVEDTDWTLEQLAQEFPREVIDALALLTHDSDEPYMDYVARIAENPVAKQVKMAALRHNLDASRLCCAPDAPQILQSPKRAIYQQALRYLSGE